MVALYNVNDGRIDDGLAQLQDIDVEDSRMSGLLEALGEMLSEVEQAQRAAEIERQILRMGRVSKNLKADEEKLAAHIAEVQTKLLANQKRQEFVKTWLLSVMEAEGIPKVKDALVSVYTQANPPSVFVTDEALVPDAYKRATLVLPLAEVPPELVERATVQVLKQAIIAAVKEDGEAVPGTMITRGSHVRVK